MQMQTNHFNQVRVKDLLDSTSSFIYCPMCGAEFSATRGDYFQLSPDHVFEHCGEPMWLATKQVVIHRLSR